MLISSWPGGLQTRGASVLIELCGCDGTETAANTGCSAKPKKVEKIKTDRQTLLCIA